MATLVKLLLIALIIAGGLWMMLKPEAEPRATIRFVLSLQVAVAGEEFSGSGVWELTRRLKHHSLPGPVPYEDVVRGEAIVLTSQDGDRLVALKRPHGPLADTTYSALIVQCVRDWENIDELVRRLQMYSGRCEPIAQPAIIEFPENRTDGIEMLRYESDPATADDVRTVTKLAATVETTDEPVSTGIAQVLPENFLSSLDSIAETGSTVANSYYLEDFSTETKR